MRNGKLVIGVWTSGRSRKRSCRIIATSRNIYRQVIGVTKLRYPIEEMVRIGLTYGIRHMVEPSGLAKFMWAKQRALSCHYAGSKDTFNHSSGHDNIVPVYVCVVLPEVQCVHRLRRSHTTNVQDEFVKRSEHCEVVDESLRHIPGMLSDSYYDELAPLAHNG